MTTPPPIQPSDERLAPCDRVKVTFATGIQRCVVTGGHSEHVYGEGG